MGRGELQGLVREDEERGRPRSWTGLLGGCGRVDLGSIVNLGREGLCVRPKGHSVPPSLSFKEGPLGGVNTSIED